MVAPHSSLHTCANKVCTFCITIIACFLFGCNSPGKKASPNESSIAAEKLAKQYCGSCHLYPSPSLLDKKSWKTYVLPRMGNMMGIYASESEREDLMGSGSTREIVDKKTIFPKEPIISPQDWQKIQDFFLSHAPDLVTKTDKRSISVGLKHFQVQTSSSTLSPPSTTLVHIPEQGGLFMGDAHTKLLYEFDADLNLVNMAKVGEGAVHLEKDNESLWLTTMGSFSPTDENTGFVLRLATNGKGYHVPIQGLRRPVHTAFGDLNLDGQMDLVISEYGKWAGRLRIFLNQGKKGFAPFTLIDQMGAIRSIIRDTNKDGLPDILALFGQGKEAIYLCTNTGDGSFAIKPILQFNPSMGSSFFDLVDWNGDGYDDIIYTSGDHADFPTIPKSYHGIYVFVNDQQNRFSQAFFYPQQGAYAAIPKDFDQDGDLDIASISFFPDYEQGGQESFLYLENNGKNIFTATTFENNTQGRWLVMDSGDIDQDGDEDIVLGSLAFEVIPANGLVAQWKEEGIPFVLLENILY